MLGFLSSSRRNAVAEDVARSDEVSRPTSSGGEFEKFFSILLGSLCNAWGTFIVMAWMGNHDTLAIVAQFGPIMRFNTAVLFTLLGSAIIARGFERRLLSSVLAGIVAATGAVTLLQYLLQADFGIDELLFHNPHLSGDLAGSRMSINSATCAVLVGLSLILLRDGRGRSWRLLVTGLLASAAAAVSVVAIFGHFTGLIAARGWFGSGGMSVPTAIGYFSVSAWICWLTARRETRTARGRVNWLPLTAGNAAVVATLALWHGLEYQDNQNVEQHVHRQFTTLCVELTYSLKHYDGVLTRMAARWNAAGQTPEPIWRADVKNYLQALRGFDTIAWVDADLKPRRVMNSPEFDFDAGQPIPAELLKWLQLAAPRTAQTIVAPNEKSPHERDIWLCKPITNAGMPDGWIVAVFDLRRLMREAIAHTSVEGQQLAIQSGTTELFRGSQSSDPGDLSLKQSRRLDFGGLSLNILDTPSRAWTSAQHSWLPAMTMFAGLIMSALLMSTLHLAASAREMYAHAMATQRRLRKTMALQQAILDNAQRSIISVSRDGVIQVFNRAAERTLGYSAAEMVGKHTPTVIHDSEEMAERARRLTEEFGRPLESPMDVFTAKPLLEGSEEREWTYVRKDGTRFPVLLSVCPIRDSSGEIPGFLGIANDITERRRLDAELERARLAAESASRAKSEFLANMSHEIRTPMNGIIGMTELMLTTEVTPDQRESLEIIQDSADALLTIVNDVLDFSKIEAGKLDLSSAPFDLGDKVGNAMRMLSGRAAQKGLELICSIDARIPRLVVGDADRLRQIIVNLVGNAIKFTTQGEILLHVEPCADDRSFQDASRCRLHFAVTDTGMGIPRDKQEAIFAAFAQADSSTTRQFGGTGLGLTISSRLVEMMGGRIWVESEVGQGSTFHFTAEFDQVPDGELPGACMQLKSLDGLSVLIVDDIDANRRILCDAVSRAGMRPHAVASASEGLAAAFDRVGRGQPFAAIITDYLMPGLDGLELTRVIRGADLVADTPIIMLSSAANAECIERGRQLGIHSCLAKPIKQADLLEALRLAIDASRPPQPKQQTMSAEKESEQMDESDEQHVPARSLRVLLAEDNPINQRVSSRMLERDGHHVTIANNGREAVELSQRQAFDLILMDVQMPEMDGFQATAAIRALEPAGGKHLPIIAMTAHAMQGDRERCLAAGMDSYITKPVRGVELRRELATIQPACDEPACESTSEPATGPCDWSRSLEAVDGNVEFLFELVNLFLEDVPPTMTELRRAVAQGDAPRAGKLAHRLRGSCQPFCAGVANTAAEQFESQAQSDVAVDELKASFVHLDATIESLLRQLSSLSNASPSAMAR
jgi:PAS domain S-box-containing protein